MITDSGVGRSALGKNAPDRSHIGMRSRFMMAWKPCVDSMRHAITRPRFTRPNATRPIVAVAATTLPPVRAMPASGASGSRKSPCSTARVVPPSAWPRTIELRPIGATRTPCRNPARRSSTVAMVEKIAVKSSTSATMPGYMYSR